MMTQTHILVSTAIWGRSAKWPVVAATVAGGIVPDAAIFVLYGIEKAKGTPERTIWQDVYWQPFWQDVVALGNSIPLYGVLLLGLLGLYYTQKYSPNRFSAVTKTSIVFVLSCLAHLLCDLPVHHDDAHRHFFPLSDYKFISPVSYWDPKHHGIAFSIFEAILGLTLVVIIWRSTQRLLAKIGIGLLATSYAALPAYFAYRFFACSG